MRSIRGVGRNPGFEYEDTTPQATSHMIWMAMKPSTAPFLSSQSRRGEVAFVAVLGLILVGYFIVRAYPLNDIFLLVEYRQWTFHPQFATFLDFFDPSKVFRSDAYTIAFSRSASLFVSMIFGSVCQYDAQCHNALHLLMIVGAVSFLVFTMRSLSSRTSWLPPLVVASLFLFSVPTLDALSWQATLLDKTACLFCSLALWISSRIRVDPRGRRDFVLANVAIFVPVVIAYNAKEAAFFLMPAVSTLVLMRALRSERKFGDAIALTLKLVALPLTYAIAHVGIVAANRVLLSGGEFQRVTGGNASFNAEFYTRFFLNMVANSWGQFRAAVISAAALVVIALVIAARRQERTTLWLLVWCIFAFAGSIIIPLRTSATAPFYLLVPMLYLSLLFGATVEAMLVSAASPIMRRVGLVFGVGLVVFHVAMFEISYRNFTALPRLSKNFRTTLSGVKQEIELSTPKRIVLVRSKDQPQAYMFVANTGDGSDHALAPYLLPPGASSAALDALDRTIVDVEQDNVGSLLPGDLRITLDKDMNLKSAERGH